MNIRVNLWLTESVAAGVMNILWIAALSVLVGLEKLVPRSLWLSATTGVILTAWGAWIIADSFR